MTLLEANAPSASVETYWYSMYGLLVHSDVRLPTEPLARRDSAQPDVRITRRALGPAPPTPVGRLVAELRCYGPCHGGDVYSSVYRGSSGSWVCNPGVAVCYIPLGADRVDVYSDPGVGERTLGLVLAGEVSTVLLQRRARACLHASAVLTRSGAVAFLGPQGRGKSTMAAAFVRRGAALLTDDILALNSAGSHFEAMPGLPLMKLWRQSVERTLELGIDLPDVIERMDKKLVTLEGRYAYASAPALLRGLFLLDRYEPQGSGPHEVRVRRLVGQDAITALLSHTSHPEFLTGAEMGDLLRTYARLANQVQLSIVRFPNGFEHQAAIHARISAELANL